MDLNNINISDLKEKLLQFADKKTLIKFGIGFGSIILFLIGEGVIILSPSNTNLSFCKLKYLTFHHTTTK